MPGHSTEVHQAVSPAPEPMKELVHIEAKPHRGQVKVHAHVMEGGQSSHHEHIVPHMAAAHEKMGEYMGEGEQPAEEEAEALPAAEAEEA